MEGLPYQSSLNFRLPNLRNRSAQGLRVLCSIPVFFACLSRWKKVRQFPIRQRLTGIEQLPNQGCIVRFRQVRTDKQIGHPAATVQSPHDHGHLFAVLFGEDQIVAHFEQQFFRRTIFSSASPVSSSVCSIGSETV